MERVTSAKRLVALLVAVAALAAGSLAGVSHLATPVHGGKRLSWCPPMC